MACSHRSDLQENYQMCSYYFQDSTFYKLKFPNLIYFALVYPYLTYGNLTWGNAYKSHIQKLVNIQKKIVRLMTFKSYSDHTEPIFNDLKILNLYKLNEYLTCIPFVSVTGTRTPISVRVQLLLINIILEGQRNFPTWEYTFGGTVSSILRVVSPRSPR